MPNLPGFLSLLFFSTSISAQSGPFDPSHPVWDRNRQWLVIQDRIHSRSEAESRFSRGAQPAIGGPGFQDGSDLSFDGTFAYRAANRGRESIALSLGWLEDSNLGSRWIWKRPAVLQGHLRFLAGAMERALLLRMPGIAEPGQTQKASIELYDFAEERLTPLLDLDAGLGPFDACAVASNWDFYLLLSNGSLFRVPFGQRTITALETDGLRSRVEGMIDLETDERGARVVPVPPHFTGNPFLGPTGEIYFPIQARQKNHWDEAAIMRLWNTLTPSAQQTFIASEKWPILGGYDGSDETFVLLGFDPATRKLRRVPCESMGTLVRRDGYTRQWQLAEPGWVSFAEERDGGIVPLESLVEPVKPEEKRGWASSGGGSAPSRP